MIARNHRFFAWLFFGVFVAGLLSSFAVGVVNQSALLLGDNLLFVAFAGFAGIGLLLALRRPENRLGWIFSALSAGIGLIAFTAEYSRYTLVTRPGALPGGLYAAWLYQWTWFPLLASLLTFPFLLFPDGRLPSRRWRPVAKLVGALVVFGGIPLALTPQLEVYDPSVKAADPNQFRVANPFGISEAKAAIEAVGVAFFALLLVLAVASVVALILRFRRAASVERQQIKWFMFAGALLAACLPIVFVLEIFDILIPSFIFWTLLSFLPVSAGIAILKYRLYDIDLVINKTVVYGALAVFITAVYVGIVVGIGTVVGQGDRPNLGLSILATAVVAVAFEPARERVQRFANRLVYGKRATPYEVLSHFAKRMASTYAADELLPQMARVVSEGTGSASAYVWLNVGGELLVAGAWPGDAHGASARFESGGADLPTLPNSDLSVPVRDRGEMLGAISIAKPRAEPATEADRKLLADLASQAGLVLRNVRLIEELRASRQRIVSAQDEERRRIERNIHDGAQQQLVALNVKLGLARTLANKDLGKTEELISQLQSETQDALENLRDLARGIYPPLLADQGLVAALEAQARKAPVPVKVFADGVGRFPRDAEAAVYFCSLEALQNVAKYAKASHVVVRLGRENGHLAFEVEDDGDGFDPQVVQRGSGLTNMADRIEALGGTLTINSEPRKGTVVRGSIPVEVSLRTDSPALVG